jgi:hypothetical protein
VVVGHKEICEILVFCSPIYGKRDLMAFNMAETPHCDERMRLMEIWVNAAGEHVCALRQFHKKMPSMPAERVRFEITDLNSRQARIEDALKALDQHREQHG